MDESARQDADAASRDSVLQQVREYADRACRKLLENPDRARELVALVEPAAVALLDWSQARLLPREQIQNDWRLREPDVVWEAPFYAGLADAAECRTLAVSVLMEHQSAPDPSMPFRLLSGACHRWEQDRRVWEMELGARGRPRPLRLTPVLPVVLHTGPTPWSGPRRMADLFDGPAAAASWAPGWELRVWDLALHTLDELLAGPPLLQALAAPRAQTFSQEGFAAAMERILSTIGKGAPLLLPRGSPGWGEAVRFVLGWGAHKRPRAEWPGLAAISHKVARRFGWEEELKTVEGSIAEVWAMEAFDRGLQEGLETLQGALLEVLERRFGSLPGAFRATVASCRDTAALRKALVECVDSPTLPTLP